MSIKRLGHLVGATGAAATKTTTTEASRMDPLTPQVVGTKAHSRGEPVTFESVNRNFVALSENFESVAALFDAPTVREDRIEPYLLGSTKHGASALADVAIGAQHVNISAGTQPQAAWIYHGLYASELSRALRLVRRPEDGVVNADVHSPVDVRIGSTTTSVFYGLAASQGSPVHGIPTGAAFCRKIAPTFAPYGGSPIGAVVDSWDGDGPRLSARTWSELYARPGCLVAVEGSASNDGLYRIAALAHREGGAESGKAVLAGAGLHKVTLAAPLALGARVSWNGAPNEAVPGLGLHFGFVAYISGSDHYISPASASEAFYIPAIGATSVSTLAGVSLGRLSTGNIGSGDAETGNTRNWNLTVGTVLTDSVGTSAIITAVIIGDAAPVFLADVGTEGLAYIVNPPGFSLSPGLSFTPDELLGGDYVLECKTLTTLRERALSGAGLAQGQFEDPTYEARLTRAEYDMLQAFLKQLKVGDQWGTVSPVSGVNGYLAPAAVSLGETRWKVTVVNETDAVTAEAAGILPTNLLSLTTPAYGANTVNATVLRVSSNTLVVDNVRRDLDLGWDPSTASGLLLDDEIIIAGGVGVGTVFTAGGKVFRVTVIDASPELTAGSGTAYLPDSLLSAAYKNLLVSDPARRTSAHGRWLGMDAQAPVELVLSDSATSEAAIRVWGDEAVPYDVISARNKNLAHTDHSLQLQITNTGAADDGVTIATRASTPNVYLGEGSAYAAGPGALALKRAVLSYASGVLALGDENTGLTTPVPFSEATAPFDGLPPGTDSILGALNQLTQAGTAGAESYSVTSSSLIYAEGGIPAYPGHTLATQAGVELTLSTGSAVATVSSHPGSPITIAPGDVIRVLSSAIDGTPSYEYHLVQDLAGAPTLFTLTDVWAGVGVTAVADWAVVTDPLLVAWPALTITTRGVSTSYAAGSAACAPNTDYVLTATSLGIMALAVSTSVVLADTAVSLAYVSTGAYGVETVTPIALRSASADTRTDIFVGGAFPELGVAEDSAKQVRQFATIGEAFKAIERWELSSYGHTKRSWRIFVVSATLEVDDLDKGISLPLRVPADNITIIGSGAHDPATTAPVVEWRVESALFDPNGKRAFCINGMSAVWSGVWTSAGARVAGTHSLERAVVSNEQSANSSAEGMHLHEVHVSGGPGLLCMDSLGTALTITSCSVSDAWDYGVWIRSSAQADVRIRGLRVQSGGTHLTTSGASCVHLQSCYRTQVSGLHIDVAASQHALRIKSAVLQSDVSDVYVLNGGATSTKACVLVEDPAGRVTVRRVHLTMVGLNTSVVHVSGADTDARVVIEDATVTQFGVASDGAGFLIDQPNVVLSRCRHESAFTGVYMTSPAFSVNNGGVHVLDCSAKTRVTDLSPVVVTAGTVTDRVYVRGFVAECAGYAAPFGNAVYDIQHTTTLDGCSVSGTFSAIPAPAQYAVHVHASNCVLRDFSTTYGRILIDSASGAEVYGGTCEVLWLSSTTYAHVCGMRCTSPSSVLGEEALQLNEAVGTQLRGVIADHLTGASAAAADADLVVSDSTIPGSLQLGVNMRRVSLNNLIAGTLSVLGAESSVYGCRAASLVVGTSCCVSACRIAGVLTIGDLCNVSGCSMGKLDNSVGGAVCYGSGNTAGVGFAGAALILGNLNC